MVNQYRKCILGPVNAGYSLAYSSLLKKDVDRPFLFYPKPFRSYRARNFLNIYKEDPSISDSPEKVGHLEYKEPEKMSTIDCLLVDSCITKTRKTIRHVKPLLHKNSSVIFLNQDISLWMEYNSLFEDPLNRPKLYLGKFQKFPSTNPENVIQTSSLPYLRLCGMPVGPNFDWDTSSVQTIDRLPEKVDQALDLNPIGKKDLLSPKQFLTEQICDLILLTTKSLPNPQMKRNAICSWLELTSKLPYFGHLDKSLLSFDTLYRSSFLKPVTFLNVPSSKAKTSAKHQCIKTLLKFATPYANDDTLHSFMGQLINFSVRNYNTLFPSLMPEPPHHLFSSTKKIPLINVSD
ncbi:uncharacterized protein SOCG_03251 [Schizosaccharomyces octosporus yFS286]|uniref:Uncharacterized protein n=1 Tax=Schizosaccharomyces octosporus (strain yFS286) TaxID=483514 RepID=S9PY76_SCHOY|nr:uncharacterized protein SOCG_03251 [Schizosaccharomyces octosporus yFS286]EPX74036.1 hypothetical protein SOCG_03251 [Schizosaccharomyces octosporus yFS286]